MGEGLQPEVGYYANARPEMRAYIPISARTILDIGCGEGRFLGGLEERDRREYWGVEPVLVAATKAGERLDRILAAPVECVLDQLPDGYFDCICLNDVIEHLVDPWALLLALKAKLRAGGVLVVSIPNVRHYKHLWQLLARGEWRYQPEGILDRTHLRFFTRKSIEHLFHETGYVIQLLEGLWGSRKWKARIWGLLSLGAWRDVRYPQFAVVASPGTRFAG